MKPFYMIIMVPLILLANALSNTAAHSKYQYSEQECKAICNGGFKRCLADPRNKKIYGTIAGPREFCAVGRSKCMGYCMTPGQH